MAVEKRQPGHLQIEVDRATRERGFPLTERDRLVQKLLPLLKEKKYDAVLQEAVEVIASTLQANLGKPRPAADSVPDDLAVFAEAALVEAALVETVVAEAVVAEAVVSEAAPIETETA